MPTLLKNLASEKSIDDSNIICVERAYQSILAFENVLKAFGIPSTERTESIAYIFFCKICFNVIHSCSCFENDFGIFWLESSKISCLT